MTEKEKMLAGMFYNAMDPQLFADRQSAKNTCQEFNALTFDKLPERRALLKSLFQTDNTCHIEPSFFCDYGYNIEIGKNFYANHNCIILDVNKVKIGDNVMFAPNVQIYTATHPVNAQERISGKEMGYPIEIGDNVWLGGGVIVCPGVKIGKNTTIAAGSVVIKDIPESVLAGGNPCKVIKNL
ncbi:sugar O-acetyltransferase [Clostridium sp. CS001]|uniref:sugar O-acetyltransferase n=1 Tax=Clostridium sp. CS001 TaxID=2880648 RepID=UPI0021F4C2B1|nr:sugar O-acetyltransferase [Clostridium sp. CS001]